MFKLLALGALLVSTLVRADPNPTEPGPSNVYNAGGQCRIVWTPDPTGLWKVMNIELMTGSNFQMVHLTTVATVDGTDAKASPFVYPCPAVKPNSAIYFYQFTSPGANTTLWTTRFTLADAKGESTPPTEDKQPGTGEAIPWGTGELANPADAKPPPGGASTAANGTVPAVTPTPSGSTVTPPPAAQLPPAAEPESPTSPSASASSSSAGQAASVETPAGGSQKSGAGSIVVGDRMWGAAVALLAAAVTFSVAA